MYKLQKRKRKEEIKAIQEKYINTENNNCLIFPRPMDQVYKTKGPLYKIINSDIGYKIEAIDVKTKKKVSIHSSKMSNVSNNPKHILNILKKIPLKMGSPIESIQGRNSTMRRNLLAKLVKNSMRGTILSHPTLIDTIILPESFRKSFVIYEVVKTLTERELFAKNFDEYIYPIPFGCSLLVKRDPVLTRGSYVSFDKIGFWNGDCIIMPQVCLELMHGDIDGDENSIGIIMGIDVKIEQTLTYNPKFNMYIPFNSTRLIFSQSHSLYMYGNVPLKYEKLFKFVLKRIKNENIPNDLTKIEEFKENFNIQLDPQYTRQLLNEMLLYITMCEGSRYGYEFVNYILKESNKLSNGQISTELFNMETKQLAVPGIFMAGDNLADESIRKVVDSKSKGNYSGYLNMCKKLQKIDNTIDFISTDNSYVGQNADTIDLNLLEKKKELPIKNTTVPHHGGGGGGGDNGATSNNDIYIQEELKRETGNQMIINSHHISDIAYKTNSRYTYFRSVVVHNDHMVYYGEQALINVYDLIHPSLIISPGIALYILLSNDDDDEN